MTVEWALMWSLSLVAAAGVGPVYDATPDWISDDTRVSTGAALVDLDRDGWLDLVVANGNDIYRQRVAVYYNQGDGTYPGVPDWLSGDQAYNGHLDVADVDGDGWLDVAVALLLNEGGPAAKLYLNNSGTLSSLPDWTSTEKVNAFGVAFGDVNNDGRPDLAVATGWPYSNPHAFANTVHLNIGGQLEATASWESDDTWDYSGALWVDADDDGWLDLVGLGNDTDTWIYRNLGGTLETTASWRTIDNSGQFAIMATAGDVTGDGVRDLFTTDNSQLFNGSGDFRQYDGLAGGLFTNTPTWTYQEGYTSAVALADVNDDGNLDLVTGAWWDPARLFFSDGTGIGAVPDWSSGVSSVVEKIVFGDVDADGLRPRVAVFPAGGTRLLYLEHQPIEQIDQVLVDGLALSAAQYTFSREHGWVTVAVTPATEVQVHYTYSRRLDMAVTNWDNFIGNYVYYNQLPPPVPGDIDGDGDVDLADFSTFSVCFGLRAPTAECPPTEFDYADLNGDGWINLTDFSTFSVNFTG